MILRRLAMSCRLVLRNPRSANRSRAAVWMRSLVLDATAASESICRS
ncbi:Uncharacterised protein [Mycobacteroides abscessus subsp. abscessus]|nr:Uncharacterised protein [Mycobacteroides abscessus subsp. abscessus]